MERDIADELVDFFGNEDVHNNTLALALLEPLKIQADYEEDAVGEEAFLRDHKLLPKLIVHPKMTLEKILKVYPNLPHPNYFNKNAELRILLGEWLPILSNYSRTYPVETESTEVQILNIIFASLATEKTSTKKTRRRSKKRKTNNQATY